MSSVSLHTLPTIRAQEIIIKKFLVKKTDFEKRIKKYEIINNFFEIGTEFQTTLYRRNAFY